MKTLTLILSGIDDLNLGGVGADETKQTPDTKEAAASEKKDKVEITDTVETTEKLPNPENTVAVDKAVFSALLKAVENLTSKESSSNKSLDGDLATAIKKLADAAEAQARANDSASFIGARPVEVYEIDREDLLEIPVMFFTNSVSFALYDDTRDNHIVKTPYGRGFKFRAIQRTIDKSSTRNPVYTNLSCVLIRSKKEADWLRNHTLFGLKFYEKKDDISSEELKYQEYVVRAWNVVSNMSEFEVMQRCVSSNIKVDTTNIPQLRKKLAWQMARSLAGDDARIRNRNIESASDFLTEKIKGAEQFESTPFFS
jgi:hypothetical protein